MTFEIRHRCQPVDADMSIEYSTGNRLISYDSATTTDLDNGLGSKMYTLDHSAVKIYDILDNGGWHCTPAVDYDLEIVQFRLDGEIVNYQSNYHPYLETFFTYNIEALSVPEFYELQVNPEMYMLDGLHEVVLLYSVPGVKNQYDNVALIYYQFDYTNECAVDIDSSITAFDQHADQNDAMLMEIKVGDPELTYSFFVEL